MADYNFLLHVTQVVKVMPQTAFRMQEDWLIPDLTLPYLLTFRSTS